MWCKDCQSEYGRERNKILHPTESKIRDVLRICKQCGIVFEVKYPYQHPQYCSRECAYIGNRSKIKCKCLTFGKEFEVWTSYIVRGGGKYCSVGCKSIARRKRINRVCQQCGKEFETTQYKVDHERGKFCSDECSRKFRIGKKWSEDKCLNLRYIRRGENAYQWKDGVTSLNNQIRHCTKMRKWILSIFARDNYRDWFSGCKGTRKNPIQAHHIIPFHTIIEKYNITTLEEAESCEELWDINNGITMLKNSHKAYHDMWGW